MPQTPKISQEARKEAIYVFQDQSLDCGQQLHKAFLVVLRDVGQLYMDDAVKILGKLKRDARQAVTTTNGPRKTSGKRKSD